MNNIKIRKGRSTITTDIAYIAGFFDGEGCIRIKRASQGGNSYYIWLAITNSNKPILEFVMGIFGGNVRQAERTINKVVYHYLITSSEAIDMLKILLAFLREKKRQAELAIFFHENKERLSPKVKEEYCQKMKSLKRENPELLEVKK